MNVTLAEVLADSSLKKSLQDSYLSRQAQGSVNIVCTDSGVGIWNGHFDGNDPVYNLSLTVLEKLRDWNWIYDLLYLGYYPCNIDYFRWWKNESELIREFRQTGRELAYQVKREAPLCQVIFWDDLAWLNWAERFLTREAYAKGHFQHKFSYEVLMQQGKLHLFPWKEDNSQQKKIGHRQITLAEVLADFSIKNPIYNVESYPGRQVQGSIQIYCDYCAEGIWGGRLKKNDYSPVYTLSRTVLEKLKDWNLFYEIYMLGDYPDENGLWEKEPDIINEFTQAGRELACEVKMEAPLCKVSFWDEMAWLASEGASAIPDFNYDVLLNADGQPWLCLTSETEKYLRYVRRLQNPHSRERSKVFRAALYREIFCKHIRVIDVHELADHPPQYAQSKEEAREEAREEASYVIVLSRRKKNASPPLQKQVLKIQSILQQCLEVGEHLEYKHRALWVVAAKYTISFSIEAYNKNTTTTVHLDDKRPEDTICDYGTCAGEPTIEPLYRMSTTQACNLVRKISPKAPFSPEIINYMKFEGMQLHYPNPADRFVASVKLCCCRQK